MYPLWTDVTRWTEPETHILVPTRKRKSRSARPIKTEPALTFRLDRRGTGTRGLGPLAVSARLPVDCDRRIAPSTEPDERRGGSGLCHYPNSTPSESSNGVQRSREISIARAYTNGKFFGTSGACDTWSLLTGSDTGGLRLLSRGAPCLDCKAD
jgi:hypothetical protein